MDFNKTLECNEGTFDVYLFWYLLLLPCAPGLTLQC